MENQQSRSKWDDLARELGADVPPADEPQRPSQRSEAKQKPAPPAKPLPAPPKRPPSNWEGLMTDLGLAPPEPARPVEPEAKAVEREASRPVAPPPPTAPAREPRPARPRRPIGARAEPELPAERTPEAAPPPTEPPPPPPEARAVQPEAEAEPRQSGSISLWHRIFGSPEEQAKKIADVARAAEPPPPEVPAAERFEAEVIEPTAGGGFGAAMPEAEALEAGEEVSPEPEERPKKRRPSRRRRRGRGRKGEDQGRPPAEAVEATPDLDESAEELEVLEEEEVEQAVPESVDELPERRAVRSPAGKATSSSHRSIPSWEETIGILVDLNMQARSQRKHSAPASRGKSRGGRRRKKS
jgi:hypothetical protein